MDKLVSHSIYFLAAAILAEILEFLLHSVLAFGGVSVSRQLPPNKKQEILLETALIIVEVVGEDAPFFKSGVTNLLWELRMLLLNAEQLKDIFKEFGEVEDIVIRQGKSQRESSALLVMGSKEAVIAAAQRPCGDILNPLLVVPATVTTGAASVTSEQLHPVAASQPTTRVSNGLVGASYRSFEHVTLLKMHQIAKEGSSAATASTDDKRSSYLNSMEATFVRNMYGSKYSQPVDDAEDCADSDFMSTFDWCTSNSIEFSNHTAATALGLSSECSNFSKDQDGPDTPLERGESSTLSWRGFSFRPDQGKWVAEIRPPHPVWMKKLCKKIALGSYPTKEAAARAYDVGIYYTNKLAK
ncbi:unnamed protein product [Sphagnum balticum]